MFTKLLSITGIGILMILATAALPAVPANHPYIAFTSSDVPALRAKFNNPKFADWKATILKRGTYTIDSLPDSNLQPFLLSQLWAYVFTGDTIYKHNLRPYFDPNGQPEADHASTNFNLHYTIDEAYALLYDILYNELSASERSTLHTWLQAGLVNYNTYWNNGFGNGNNIGAATNSSAAIEALAIYHEDSTAAEMAIDHAVTNIKTKYFLSGEAMFSNGACNEGPGYWNFGFGHQIQLAYVLKRLFNDDRGLYNTPFNKQGEWLKLIQGGDSAFVCFGDFQPGVLGEAILSHVASMTNDPLLRWKVDVQMHQRSLQSSHWGCFGNFPYNWPWTFTWDWSGEYAGVLHPMLLRDTVASPATCPGFPTLITMDTVNLATMRSEGVFTPALQIFVKGRAGHVAAHNRHQDIGSYQIYCDGQAMTLNPGYGDLEAFKNPVPMIDSINPTPHNNKNDGLIVSAWQNTTGLRHVALDVHIAYGVTKAARLFTMYKDKAIILLDDIPSGSVKTKMHTAWPSTLNTGNTGALVTGSHGGRMSIRCFGLDTAQLAVSSNEFAWTWLQRCYYRYHQMLTATYTASAATPLLTVFMRQPKTGNLDTAKVVYAADSIVVTMPDQGKIVFRYRTGSGDWYLPQNGITRVKQDQDMPAVSVARMRIGRTIVNPDASPLLVKVFAMNGQLLLQMSIAAGGSIVLPATTVRTTCVIELTTRGHSTRSFTFNGVAP